MGAKPLSSANFPSWVARFPPTDFRFWTDKSSRTTKPSSSEATPSSSEASPSSLAATKPSSLADKSPPLHSSNYTIPPGFNAKQFTEYFGGIIGGRKQKFFLAMSVASAGLHYCFKTMKPIPLSIWLVIFRNEGSDEFMDFNYKMGSGWNNDFDSPRVIAILQHGSVVTWNNDFNYSDFDDPNTVSDLRSKIGLRPLPPPKFTLPPAFDPKYFKEYIDTFQKKNQSFLAMNICSSNPMEPPIWLVILQNEGSSPLDLRFEYVFGWKDDVDTPRVIAILQHGSVVTWNDHQFDSPETIAKLRSKLGLPPLSKSD